MLPVSKVLSTHTIQCDLKASLWVLASAPAIGNMSFCFLLDDCINIAVLLKQITWPLWTYFFYLHICWTNYTEWTSRTCLNFLVHTVGSVIRHFTQSTCKVTSILEQAFHFTHREEAAVRGWQARAATIIFLSQTMTNCPRQITFIMWRMMQQAVISARGAQNDKVE